MDDPVDLSTLVESISNECPNSMLNFDKRSPQYLSSWHIIKTDVYECNFYLREYHSCISKNYYLNAIVEQECSIVHARAETNSSKLQSFVWIR